MGILKKILSVALSCSLACTLTVLPAEAADSSRFIKYDNINSLKSKEKNSENSEPFNVFEIYNAYYGITTTKATTRTTTKPTTTKTTTVKTTTATKKTTTATAKTTTAKTTSATKKTTTATTKTTTAKTTTATKKTTSAAKTTTTTASELTDITTTTDLTVTDITTTTDMTTSTTSANQSVFLKGIDVSQFQLNIDWNKVKASGEADFAIIRAGYGKELNQKDPYFDYNMQNAQAAGMDVGIYWYSYAYSVEDAVKEAETCYEIIKDYSFNYPVYFDVEEYGQMFNLTKAQLSAIVDAFCSTLENKGYYVGVYSSASYLESNIYEHVLQKYDVWVAEYNSGIYHYDGHYGIWQYSSTGSVDGIPVNVDLNYCYKNYPEIIGVNPEPSRIPEVTTTVSTEPAATTTTTVSTMVYGSGISVENGGLDVSAVNKEEYSFVILKAGEGGETLQVNPDFTTNLISAKEAGINCGAYWHAVSLTEEDMRKEAEMFLFMIKGYQFEYPLYLDMTDAVYTDSGLSPEEITALIKSFCSMFEEQGYYIGVHVTEDFLSSSVTSEFFELYDVWLDCSEKGAAENNFKYGMIKTKEITLDGSDVVYFNTCTRSYPTVMKYYKLNGF